MLRLRRSQVAFFLRCLESCHGEEHSMITREIRIRFVSSISSCLRKSSSFQELFSDTTPAPPSNDSLPSPKRMEILERRLEDNKKLDVKADLENSMLLFKGLGYVSPDEHKFLHSVLERTFSFPRTMFTRDDLGERRLYVFNFRKNTVLYQTKKQDESDTFPFSTLNQFLTVTKSVVCSDHTFSESDQTDLCKKLSDNINLLGDVQLVFIGKLLYHWPKGENSSSRSLLKALDAECAHRYTKDWCNYKSLPRRALKLADLFYWNGLSSSEYLKVLLPDIFKRRIRFNPKTILQALFYYSWMKPHYPQDHDCPNIPDIYRVVKPWTSEETFIALVCFVIQNETRIVIYQSLRDRIVSYVQKNVGDYKVVALASKVLHKLELNLKDKTFVFSLQESLISRVDNMPLDCCLATLILASSLKVDNADYLSRVQKRLSPYVTCFQTDVLCFLIRVLVDLSSTKETMAFLDTLAIELQNRNYPSLSSSLQYPKVNLSLMENGIFSFNLWMKCLSDFRSSKVWKYGVTTAEVFLGADYLIEVFHPDFKGPRLNTTEREFLYSSLVTYRKSSLYVFQGVDVDVFNYLKTITKEVLQMKIVPHWFADYVICTDAAGTFIPITCFNNCKPWEIKKIPQAALDKGNRFTAIWFVPANGRKHSNELVTPIWAKQRALRQLGYNTIQVDVQTWQKSSYNGDKKCYIWLTSMVQNAIFREKI